MANEDFIGFAPASESEMMTDGENGEGSSGGAGLASSSGVDDMEEDDAVIPDSRPSTPEPELAGLSQHNDGRAVLESPMSTPPVLDMQDPNGEQDSSLEVPGSPYSLLSAMTHSDMESDDWQAGFRDAGADMNTMLDSGKVLSPRLHTQQQQQNRSRKLSSASRKGKEAANGSHSSASGSKAGATQKYGKKRRNSNVIQSDRHRTDESEESSGVEVASARKEPAKARLRSRSSSGSPLLDKLPTSKAAKTKQAGPSKPFSRRTSKKKSTSPEDTDDLQEGSFRETPVVVVTKQPMPEPFVALSTGSGEALSAKDIIAQLRQKNFASLGIEASTPLPEASTSALSARVDSAIDEDSDDDLADPSQLIKAAATRVHKPPEQRRSSRQIPEAATRENIVVRKVKMPEDKSQFSLNNLHKGRQSEAERGWFGIEQAAAEVATHRDSSDDEDPAQMMNGHVQRSGSDSDLPNAPDARRREKSRSVGASKDVDLSAGAMSRVAGALSTEKKALEAVQMAQEDIEMMAQEKLEGEAIEARRLWNPDFELFIEPYVPYDPTGRSGYDLALCQAIVDGIADPASFPSDLSSVYLSKPSTIQSSISATFALYQLVAHPNTNSALANRALRILVGLLKKIPTNGPQDTDLEIYYIVDSMHKMGTKLQHIPEDLQEAADLTSIVEPSTSNKQSFTIQGRRAATLRLMQVLKAFIATKRPLPQYAASVTSLLVDMAMSPEEHEVRQAALDVLCFAFDSLDANSLADVGATLLKRLQSMLRPNQYVYMSLIPFASIPQQDIVRSLCLAILFDQASLDTPTLSQIQQYLQDPPDDSIFSLMGDANDTYLYYSVLLLQLLLSDVPKYLSSDSASEESSKVADLRSLVQVLKNLDSKIRTDVRAGNPMRNKAKNALTRLQHSLEYQLNIVSKRINASNKKQAMEKGHKVDALGQMSLAGFYKPRASSTPVPSVV